MFAHLFGGWREKALVEPQWMRSGVVFLDMFSLFFLFAGKITGSWPPLWKAISHTNSCGVCCFKVDEAPCLQYIE